MKDPVFIGVAWPYANGGLHLGHVAGSLLPPDIVRRHRIMKGHPTLMVSGSDCHGTPILLRAEKEGKAPQEVVDGWHADHVSALDRLDIDFDLFTKTTTANHQKWVQLIFTDLLEAGFIEARTQEAPFDPKAGRFLPDRYVEGTCPHCDAPGARGDQCDACGKTLDPHELGAPRSKLNPETAIEFRETEHFFFLLSRLQAELERYVAQSSGHWRPNTVNFTQNWLREGLKDRPITRDLTWGVPIPLEGFEDKRIYVWFEAVCGYLSAAVEWADRAASGSWIGVPEAAANLATGRVGARKPDDAEGWQVWWTSPKTRAYYMLGKDNIPFHTIIWPAILIAFNKAREARNETPLVLPYDVPANEFLNLGGQQFSKSRGIGIGVHEVLDRFDADAVRYYLSVNMPEGRDADWTWDDFLSKVNDELVGTIGNLVHRTLSFTQKNLGRIPDVPPDGHPLVGHVEAAIRSCMADMDGHLDGVHLKQAMRRLLEFAGWGNQAMQEAAPWKLIKEDPEEAAHVLYALLRIVKALGIFMAPFLPRAASQVWEMLNEPGDIHEASWNSALAPLVAGSDLAPPRALFRKLDPKDVPGASAPSSAADASGPAKGTSGPSPAKRKRTPKEAPGRTDEAAAADEGRITIDDFARMELRLATILGVEDHPKADKLYVLRLDVGELGERQVVAGLKAHYGVEDLVGQTVAFVANLKPAKLRGIESQGMILAADTGEIVSVLRPHRELPAGSRIR